MAGTRECSKCAKRRKKIEALRAKRQAQGKPVQAAALGAVLAVTEAVGQTLGIHGEVEDGRFQSGNVGRIGGASAESGDEG